MEIRGYAPDLLQRMPGQTEAMLLIPAGSWLRTDLGKFVLRPFVSWPWSARLQLESA